MEKIREKERGSAARQWMELVEDVSLSDEELKRRLQDIHRGNLPSFAEIVVNPGCMNQCKHCIYPEDYACHNKALSVETWCRIIDDMYTRLEFRHFIFGGRGMNQDIIEVVKYVNSKYSDVKVGMIAEAFGLEMYWDEIKGLKIDHLDISVDGLKKGHDLQRNREGAFDLTVKMMKKIMEGPMKNRNFKKVAILSTLTSLNRSEILPMFKFFNSEFKVRNFFIAPVTVINNRPDASLKLSKRQVAQFIREAKDFFGELNDAYMAFNIYEDDLGFWFRDNAKDLYEKLKADEDYFEFKEERGNNEFHLFWYPAAINSCREFIMNTNGDVFTGYVQAYGKIPEANIFGNVMRMEGTKEEFFERIVEAPAFDFFVGQVKDLQG
jgi:sulfatase maturation enzyme AslB (radical SAM superfamily)